MPALLGEVASSGALTSEMVSSITNGMSTTSATVSQVIMLFLGTAISVICLTGGVNYALKKVRGVLSKAA